MFKKAWIGRCEFAICKSTPSDLGEKHRHERDQGQGSNLQPRSLHHSHLQPAPRAPWSACVLQLLAVLSEREPGHGDALAPPETGLKFSKIKCKEEESPERAGVREGSENDCAAATWRFLANLNECASSSPRMSDKSQLAPRPASALLDRDFIRS
ncbi:uncharacterized protein WM277_005995 [Molossus nigricans]